MKKFKAITIALAAVGVGSMCGLVYADIAPYDESNCLSDYSCQATTTTYNSFIEWPDSTVKPRLDDLTSLKNLGFIPVATPFAIQLKNWGSRCEYINAVIDDAADGENGSDNKGKPMCFQTDDNNLLIPQEFCGGNGWPPNPDSTPTTHGWDVQNNCTDITTAYAAGSRKGGIVSMCEKSKATIKESNCEAFCTLANASGDKFYAGTNFTQKLMQRFINNGSCLPSSNADSSTYTTPGDNNYKMSCSKTPWINWCTGRNMHFDGFGQYTTPRDGIVSFKVVHCDIHDPKTVGVKGTCSGSTPAKPPTENQLVIAYTGAAASTSCQPSYQSTCAKQPAPTTVNNGTPTPIGGSGEECSKVQCYSPNVTFNRTGALWKITSGKGSCKADLKVTGAYTCTITDDSTTGQFGVQKKSSRY